MPDYKMDIRGKLGLSEYSDIYDYMGIVDKNDLFFYSQKIKAFLLKEAKRNPLYTYPNDSSGFGFLDLTNVRLDSFSDINKGYDLSYRKKKKKLKKHE